MKVHDNYKFSYIIVILFINVLYVIALKNLNDSKIMENCLKCKENSMNEYCKKCPALEIIDNLKILSPEETLNEIIINKKSIARFGDGELKIIFGIDHRNYQNANENISKKLLKVLNSNEENLLIGLSNSLKRNFTNLFIPSSKLFWNKWTDSNKYKLINILELNKTYGSASMSRFYFNYKNRTHVGDYVKKLKMIWDKRNIVMIEGDKTRLGVGNDLFNNAKSIQRIICPNTNAFNKYDEIFNEVIKLDKNKLIIIALGPTATILAYDLHIFGYQAIDVGHIDIEYEWYLRNATKRVKIKNKFTYQAGGFQVEDIKDKSYNKQIIAKILY